jgi:TonB family protein
MLKAVLLSAIVHLVIVLLIPSVQMLEQPPDEEYVEVETIILDTPPETAEIPSDSAAPADAGRPAIPRQAPIPTELEPLEPEMAATGAETFDWDLAFVGFESRLPDNLQARAPETPPKESTERPASLPLRQAIWPTQAPDKPAPEPEAAAAPELSPQDEETRPAEQRFADLLQSQRVRIPEAQTSPEFDRTRPPDQLQQSDQPITPPDTPERTVPEAIPPQSVERTAVTPETEYEKMPAALVRLPDTPEQQPEPEPDDIIVTAEQTPYTRPTMPPELRPETEDMTAPALPKQRTISTAAAPAEVTPDSASRTYAPDAARPVAPPRFAGLASAKSRAQPQPEAPLPTFPNLSSVIVTQAAEHPEKQRLAQRFEPEQPVENEASAPRRVAAPDSIPLAQQPSEFVARDTDIAPRSATPQPVQTRPELSVDIPPATRQMEAIAEMTRTPKPTVQTAETVIAATERPLPPRDTARPAQRPTLFADLQSPRSSVQERADQHNTGRLRVQQLGSEALAGKREFAVSDDTSDTFAAVQRPGFGMFVRKAPPSPHFEEPELTKQEDDVVEHVEIEQDEAETSAFAIEGPAAGRDVLYKPPNLPDLELDMEVTIRLKFWVLPDGSVGEVVPLQRGDVRLERAAIQYLKGWRFTPVAPEQPIVWGIIPITYKLQ